MLGEEYNFMTVLVFLRSVAVNGSRLFTPYRTSVFFAILPACKDKLLYIRRISFLRLESRQSTKTNGIPDTKQSSSTELHTQLDTFRCNSVPDA
jgi:hypothetical protein